MALKTHWKLLEYEFRHENFEDEDNKTVRFQWYKDKNVLDRVPFICILAPI